MGITFNYYIINNTQHIINDLLVMTDIEESLVNLLVDF